MNIHDATEQAYKNGYVRGMKDAVKWISVKERLPELHIDEYKEPDGSRMQFEASDEQLVFSANGDLTMANYETGPVFQGWVGDHGQTIRNVTHWMPLPEPPKRE